MLVVESLDVTTRGEGAEGRDARADAVKVTLIGANGAADHAAALDLGPGASRAGRVTFEGRDITGWRPMRSSAGCLSLAQGRLVFANLPVEEESRAGAYRRSDRAGIRETTRRSTGCFRACSSGVPTAGSSQGEQQCCDRRALMSRPGCCCSTSLRSASPRAGARDLPHHPGDQRRGVTVLLVEQTRTWRFRCRTRLRTETGKVQIEDQRHACPERRCERPISVVIARSPSITATAMGRVTPVHLSPVPRLNRAFTRLHTGQP